MSSPGWSTQTPTTIMSSLPVSPRVFFMPVAGFHPMLRWPFRIDGGSESKHIPCFFKKAADIEMPYI
jgi:hypothetical protein